MVIFGDTMKAALFALLIVAGNVCFSQSVDREDEIVIGGIRQYVTFTGDDASLPLLLFLHGGPGGSVMGYASKFTDKLRQHFIVVQWDQRETGKTLEKNPSPEPLSVALFENDTRELIDTLLRRFHRGKLYLAGHSWGTVLGFSIARKYPAYLYAYIAIGPMINQLESERMSLKLLKQQAEKNHDEEEREELSQINIPFENGDQLYYHRKWLLAYSGSRKALTREYVNDWAARWLGVFNEASRDNLLQSLTRIDCPVYFFAGKKDFQTNSTITEAYYHRVTAPKKGLYWFDCGHSIPSAQPARMQRLIIEKVLPETVVGIQ